MSDKAAIIAAILTVIPGIVGWLVALRLRHNLREKLARPEIGR